MKTSKRIILLAALFALSLTSHAQRFEWAKTIDGYDQSSSDVGNKIAGSMTDSDGNLYICAQYSRSASLCGVNLPDRGETINMVVAKISPEGEMVWHKEIYGYGTTGGAALGLLPMGDTAMMGSRGLNAHRMHTVLPDLVGQSSAEAPTRSAISMAPKLAAALMLRRSSPL